MFVKDLLSTLLYYDGLNFNTVLILCLIYLFQLKGQDWITGGSIKKKNKPPIESSMLTLAPLEGEL